LIEVIESRRPLVAGLTGGSDYRLSSGQPIELDTVYQVLVSDSLYTGGNYYELFRLDPDPAYLNLDWRLPAIEWVRSLGTSRTHPITDQLDVLP
jgi:hypothetical protein